MRRNVLGLLILLIVSTGWKEACLGNSADASTWGKVAIQHGGRKKPFTTFAHEMTTFITGKRAWPSPDEDGKQVPALDGVLYFLLSPSYFENVAAIYVGYADLKVELGLDKNKTQFRADDLRRNTRLWELIREGELKKLRNPRESLPRLLKEAEELGQRLVAWDRLMDGQIFRVIPHPQKGGEASWLTIAEMRQLYSPEDSGAIISIYERMKESFVNKNSDFNSLANDLVRHLVSLNPAQYADPKKLKAEYIYKEWHPSGWAWKLYLAAALICFMIRRQQKSGSNLYRLAWFFIVSGFLFQVAAFALRVYVSGRAPVTNMYETVIWVALGTMAFGIIFEAKYRSGYFILSAAPFASVVLIIADLAPIILDRSIQPLQPVLRNNFWLTVHVLTVTLSYAAFLLATSLAHVRMGRYLLKLKSELDAQLDLYVYRALQVGVFLLASGTILGGVWANYSWGRFWDWDPKETWALITLLIYLAVLHGRLAGWWKGFGLSVGSIIGFLSVIMTWYGVNFVLGKGLHSYGFGKGGGTAVTIFVITQLILLLAVGFRMIADNKTKA